MQRRPSLTVNLVHVGITLQKEGHHLHAAIYAGLCRREENRDKNRAAAVNVFFCCFFKIYLSIKQLFQLNLRRKKTVAPGVEQ